MPSSQVDYDRNASRRTTVVDDQSDFFEIDSNAWLSDEVCPRCLASFSFFWTQNLDTQRGLDRRVSLQCIPSRLHVKV